MEPLSIGRGDASANSGYAPVEGFGKRAINGSGFCAATRIRVKLPSLSRTASEHIRIG